MDASQQQEAEQDMPSRNSSIKKRGKGEKRNDVENVHELDEWSQRETTANIPIVRSNTPRVTAYSSTAEQVHKSVASTQTSAFDDEGERYEMESLPPFPSKPPSAPPVPEAVTTFDVIEKSKLPEAVLPLQEEQHVAQPAHIMNNTRVTQAIQNMQDIDVQGVQEQLSKMPVLATQELTTPLPQKSLEPSSRYYRLVGFAIYLLCLLVLVLVFAVLQGAGIMDGVLAASVVLLGVPWMVLVYGLLGGCVSCLVTLGKMPPENPPVFVVITWYARPFIAVILSLFAYLLLNSGLLLSAADGGVRHQELALLVGATAGLGEGWLFSRRRER